MEIQLNTDKDGFISQACPSCAKRFKVKFGEGSEKPISFCPYCGHEGRDCWWTQQQADYMGEVVGQDFVGPQMEKLARDINRMSRPGDMVQFKMEVQHSARPHAPVEPDEAWPMATFACCGERVKHDGNSRQLHCIICGAALG